jgi:hypothetical protein
MHRLFSALVLALLLVTPAAAAAAAPQEPPTLQPTSNWSGYVGTNAYYTGVNALIQAPMPAALQRLGVVASWVGIGGTTTRDLIQAGVAEVNSGPFFTYQAWYELLPENSRQVVMDIDPGAWVSVDIHEVAYNLWQISIVNGTNVWTRQFQYASCHCSAEWVVEEPAIYTGQLLPLAGVTGANFAKMSAIANGTPVNPTQLYPQTVGIVSPAGALKARPTPLGGDGASFSVSTV